MDIILNKELVEHRKARSREVYYTAHFTILQVETGTINQEVLDSRNEDITIYDKCLSQEEALNQNVISQEDIQLALLNEWKLRRLAQKEEWPEDIKYWVENDSFNQYLMIPCIYLHYGKVKDENAILIRYTDSFILTSKSAKTGSMRHSIIAQLLLSDGTVKEVRPSNISFKKEVFEELAERYAFLLFKAVTPEINMHLLFQADYVPVDTILARKVLAYHKRNIEFLQKVRESYAKHILSKGFAGSEEELEALVHNKMLRTLKEDINAPKI